MSVCYLLGAAQSSTPPANPTPPADSVVADNVPRPFPDDLSYVPGINEYLIVDVEPTPLNMPDLQRAIGYPEKARNEGYEGTVIIRLLVDPQGNAVEYRVINRVTELLADEVEKHIMDLKFDPAQVNGQPVHFWVNIPFAFKLLGGKKKKKRKKKKRN